MRSLLGIAIVMFVGQVFTEETCPTGGSWKYPVCKVTWKWLEQYKECRDPDLECVLHSDPNMPNEHLFDIHICKPKTCTQESGSSSESDEDECDSSCGSDGKCVISDNDITRAASCEHNADCLGGMACFYDSCFGEGICKPLFNGKKGALCEVVYNGNSTETRDCQMSEDIICVTDSDTNSAGISDAASIKRCIHRSCSTGSDCEDSNAVCARRKCIADMIDWSQGKLGHVFAGECEPNATCAFGYECCEDPDLMPAVTGYIPKMCQHADVCAMSFDEKMQPHNLGA